jgi:hypothetical protein
MSPTRIIGAGGRAASNAGRGAAPSMSAVVSWKPCVAGSRPRHCAPSMSPVRRLKLSCSRLARRAVGDRLERHHAEAAISSAAEDDLARVFVARRAGPWSP